MAPNSVQIESEKETAVLEGEKGGEQADSRLQHLIMHTHSGGSWVIH